MFSIFDDTSHGCLSVVYSIPKGRRHSTVSRTGVPLQQKFSAEKSTINLFCGKGDRGRWSRSPPTAVRKGLSRKHLYKSVGASVTRWLDYSCAFWPFVTIQIGPIAHKICPKANKDSQILNGLLTWPTFLALCQSGKIFPCLVTPVRLNSKGNSHHIKLHKILLMRAIGSCNRK